MLATKSEGVGRVPTPFIGLGWMTGFEPATRGTTIRCSTS
jgi:hypothetical protein